MTHEKGPYGLSVNGRAHIVLAKLQERSGHFGHIAAAVGVLDKVEGPGRRRQARRRLMSLLVFMRGVDLIFHDHANWFQITTHGEDVLAHLDAAAERQAA